MVNNILTIDLEDWKHIHYLNSCDNVPEKIEYNTGLILDLLETYDTKATFFTVGEIVENYPELIDKIVRKGHEIGFHTFYHTPLWNHEKGKFRDEIKLFRKLMLEKFQLNVYGFRAPLFSLNEKTSWAIDVLQEENFLYDSSIFPIRNLLYGVPNAPVFPYRINSSNITKNNPSGIIELPLLTYKILGVNLPVAGGIYIRFLPLYFIVKAIEKINSLGYPAVIYIHPREVDPSPPKLNLPLHKKKMFTFNTKKTLKKLDKLLDKFSLGTAMDYVKGANI